MHIDVKQILLQIVNFSILMFVLNKFLYQPILKVLDARSQKIKDGLDAAEKNLEDQAKAEEKQKELLLKTQKQAGEILDQARVEAKAAAKDIVATAKAEASDAVAKEYQILKSKLQADELKVRRHLSSVIADATASVLQGALTEPAHRSLIKKQIKELAHVEKN